MKKRIISVILSVFLLLSLTADVYATGTDLSGSPCLIESSELVTKLKFRLKFGTNDFYNNQWQTVKSLRRLNDNIYMLDYSYDYDIDDLLTKGCDSIVSLLAYTSAHLLFGKMEFSLSVDELGCSAFTCQNEDGDRLMGRNFDYKDAPCFVVWTDPEDGYASVSMVDANMMLFGDINKPRTAMNSLQTLIAPYIPLDGVNEKGLSIGVLQVKADGTAQDTGKTDIVTTVAIRAVLDKCANVNEAIALLSRFDMHDMLSSCSYHYQLSDAEGNSCVIEYINDEMRVIWGDENSAGVTTQAVTNFFLSADGVADTPEGQVRYATMQQTLAGCGGVMTEAEALQLLNGVHLNYKHKTYPWYVTTLWSSVYNASDASLTMCARMNYATVYRFCAGQPCVAQLQDFSAEIDDYTQAPN